MGPTRLMMMIVAVLGALAGAQETPSVDEDPCADAPTEAAKTVCHQMTKWNKGAKKAAENKKTVALPPGVAAGFAPDIAPIASSLEACVDMACVCQFMAGTRTTPCSMNGKTLTKVVRKEYRMLTDEERQRYHAAVIEMKRIGSFDKVARIHSSMDQSGGAHGGPAFAVWHREYIKRVEFELRKVDPEVHLPYWDSTLEWRLPRGQDSVLFSPELMGSGSGNVVTGAFANWKDTSGAPLRRDVGRVGQCFSDPDLTQVLAQPVLSSIFAYTPPDRGNCPMRFNYYSLEAVHGNVHLWVGGHMFDTQSSANDPIFYMHHAFVDFIFEEARLKNQDRARRETEYAPDNGLCSNPQHFSGARMAPFNQYRNIDGLSNKYTDELYSYAPRPTCSQTNPSCGSRFLFCDLSHGAPRCASKIRVGGLCSGYLRNEDACYNGICRNNVCIQGNVVATTVAPVTTTRPNPAVTTAPVVDCWNENQCCQTWAGRGECRANQQYMNDFCKASCGVCQPNPPLRDDCSDRHNNCASWSRSGECTRNPDWMTENCRRSCNKCTLTRAQSCAGNAQQTTLAPQNTCADISPGCYNEFACCPLWSNQGLCRTNQQFMACNCRVSCGMCNPTDYPYGACVDYHTDCAAWARSGECQKNPWMEENCRQSCNTCFAQFELPNMCGAPNQAGLIASRRQSNMRNQQTPRAGWGAQSNGMNGGWGSAGNNGWNANFDNGQNDQFNNNNNNNNNNNRGRGRNNGWNQQPRGRNNFQTGGAGWGFNSWGRRKRYSASTRIHVQGC